MVIYKKRKIVSKETTPEVYSVTDEKLLRILSKPTFTNIHHPSTSKEFLVPTNCGNRMVIYKKRKIVSKAINIGLNYVTCIFVFCGGSFVLAFFVVLPTASGSYSNIVSIMR
jgi:hypothetical protein